jgi:hypothetical protein
VDICSLKGCSGYLFFLRSFFYRQSVVAQLYGIDTTEAAPKEVFLASFFDIKLVDGILNADLVASKKLSFVGEWSFGLVANGYANAACPLATPLPTWSSTAHICR